MRAKPDPACAGRPSNSAQVGPRRHDISDLFMHQRILRRFFVRLPACRRCSRIRSSPFSEGVLPTRDLKNQFFVTKFCCHQFRLVSSQVIFDFVTNVRFLRRGPVHLLQCSNRLPTLGHEVLVVTLPQGHRYRGSACLQNYPWKQAKTLRKTSDTGPLQNFPSESVLQICAGINEVADHRNEVCASHGTLSVIFCLAIAVANF